MEKRLELSASLWAHRFVPICAAALIVCATAAACSRPKTPTLSETGQHGASPGLIGIWKSDGYGLVFVGNGDTIQIYEVTQTTCVPTATKLTRRTDTLAHAEAVYVDGYRVFLLRATPDSNEKRLQIDGTASHMVIHRIASRPARCDPPTPDTPEGNFEVFAQTWAEHYISFDAKGAD